MLARDASLDWDGVKDVHSYDLLKLNLIHVLSFQPSVNSVELLSIFKRSFCSRLRHVEFPYCTLEVEEKTLAIG